MPVNADTLAPGQPVTLLPAAGINFALGSSLDVHPDGTFYVAAQDEGAGPQPFPRRAGPGHAEPGSSGTVVTSREYAYTGVTERYQLFSVFGSLVIARSADLATVAASGTKVTEAAPGWFVTDAGKPPAAVFSADGRYLFVSDKVGDKLHIYRIKP